MHGPMNVKYCFGSIRDMGRAIPLRTWTNPYGCRNMRLPEYIDNEAHEGGKAYAPRKSVQWEPLSNMRADGRSDMKLTGVFVTMRTHLKRRNVSIYEVQCIYCLLEANSHC